MSEIKVATLNLHGRHDRWLRRRELIVSELLDTQPDLLSLQEIYRPIGQARWLRNQVNVRLSGSPGKPYRLLQQPVRHLAKRWFEAIGILTRLPVISVDDVNLGYGGRVALRANVELPSRDTLDFVAVHLHHVASDREARVEQVMQLSGWLQSHNPVSFQVVAGDFNEVPSGPAIRLMKQTYRSALAESRGYDPLATFPTALTERSDDWSGCLDYIFVSKAVPEVVNARLFCKRPAPDDPRLYPSDHVGLLATLDLEQRIS
ncbi:MAG: endonuclease/exonuclease/phosphatase family protein [Chloroflexota bacterium]|jgi:endonuclease/exonuclease/phosphatase family metal-dependent hydrolase